MCCTTLLVGVLCAVVLTAHAHGKPKLDIPDDFPQFIVPGHTEAMAALRELYYLHYVPPAGPMATLWDEWLSSSTLWPAVATNDRMNALRKRWATALSRRHIDPDGYVATHQHASIAHQHGWPFPFWKQGGEGTWGWHFSLQGVPQGWHGTEEKTQEGWEVAGGQDRGIAGHAWNIELTAARTTVRTPPLLILPDQAPFIQLRWRADGLAGARPYLEWTTEDEPEFGSKRRVYFDPITKSQGIAFTMIPVFKSPAWKGRITRLGLHFINSPSATVGIQALFTQYDTRHNINNPCFIRGCCQYFWWTRDLDFLRSNLQRMRLAMHYLMKDLGGRKEKCILAPWVGHDGRSGIELRPDGKKIIHPGRGIGNNYWDLLPMGHKDAYATIHYYDTLKDMALLEGDLAAHPEWDMPAGPFRIRPEELLVHAGQVKANAGNIFWNKATGRFICGLDVDGEFYDYGYTFINCEAIHYDFATPEQAQSILQWLSGERTVPGDTSQGKDIYHWRFAPRASTKRNLEWYGWYWSGPEKIPWGDQVQDGGAVLGFSYHDLMSRLKVRGPDDAWQRLTQIIRWFDEVQAGGGYREYYKDGKRGTLQGGGRPGGLGVDREFRESVLVPQIMIDGFLGFRPRADGFEINPVLPRDWPELTITRIHLHQLVLSVTAGENTITIVGQGRADGPLLAYLPVGRWEVCCTDSDGKELSRRSASLGKPGDALPIDLEEGKTLKLTRQR